MLQCKIVLDRLGETPSKGRFFYDLLLKTLIRRGNFSRKEYLSMSNLFYTGQSRRTKGGFSVTMKNGAALAKKLAKLERGSETAIKRTVSDFTSRAPAWVTKGIRQHYGVDTAAINEAGPKKINGASSIKVSGVSVDGATLEYKGRTLTPTHFKMSPKVQPTTQKAKAIRIPGQAVSTGSPVAMVRPPKRYTVRASILKGGRVSLPTGTFIAPAKGNVSLPFQRKGEGRSQIEAVRTLSVPQMISGKAKETIEELIATNLEKRFEHNIQQITK